MPASALSLPGAPEDDPEVFWLRAELDPDDETFEDADLDEEADWDDLDEVDELDLGDDWEDDDEDEELDLYDDEEAVGW